MKMNAIKFAQMISYISQYTNVIFSSDAIADISAAIDAGVEQPIVSSCSAQDLVAIFQAMAEGKRIEPIKHIRQVTGLGLKEAKDLLDNAVAGLR